MTRTRSVHLASLLSFAGVVLFLTWRSERPRDNARPVRLLSEQEMFAAFGDNPTLKQPVTKNCYDSFVEGTSDCTKCGNRTGIDRRDVCCDCAPTPKSGKCEYDEERRRCVDLIRWKAPIFGTPGSCGSCAASHPDRYKEDGTCNVPEGVGAPCGY